MKRGLLLILLFFISVGFGSAIINTNTEGLCDDDSDCSGSGYKCNIEKSKCYAYCSVSDNVSCAESYDCWNNTCVYCEGHTTKVDGACRTTCQEDASCVEGYGCYSNDCLKSCSKSSDCNEGYVCLNNFCIEILTDDSEDTFGESVGEGAESGLCDIICFPYACDDDNNCLTSCTSDAECALYAACDAKDNDSGSCVAYCEIGESECSDGIDNDGDGNIDHELDVECRSPYDTDEGSDPQCANGLDDNSNGQIDYPYDIGCESPEDNAEFTSYAAAPEFSFLDWLKDLLTFWN